jgi:uncharacterized protein
MHSPWSKNIRKRDVRVPPHGDCEPAVLKRLAARHATRGAELDHLLRRRRFVDLHAVVREAFCMGVERYGLEG